MERLILAAELKSREAWNLVNIVNSEDLLSAQSEIIHKEISKFYESDPSVQKVEIEILLNRIRRGFPKHYDDLKHVVELAVDSDISEVNVKRELVDLASERLSDRLSLAFAHRSWDDVFALLPELEKLKKVGFEYLQGQSDGLVDGDENSFEVIHTVDLDALLRDTSSETKIKLSPASLNEHLGGGVYRKQHTVIFGRPDSGKTTFLINLVVGFLNQGLRVCFLENEDNGLVLYKRIVTRLTGMTPEEMERDPDDCRRKLESTNISNLVLVASDAGRIEEIDRLLAANEGEKGFDVLVIDQLRNLRVKADSRVGELERAARSIREIAKRHNVSAFSVTQAGDSGEGKAVLKMGDVDWSNTGIQGACDLMLGWGVNDELYSSGYRMISFPKNKLNGTKTPTQVRVNLPLALVE